VKSFYLSLLFCALIVVVAFASRSLWGFYLWTTFPNSTAERVQSFQAKNGTARECSSSFINIVPPNKEDIASCFSNASEEQIVIYDERAGEETVTRTYRCDGNGFAGEVIYTFYSTNEAYICKYKIAESWEDISQYQTGDIAGYSPEPGFLTKLLITIFQ